ncbi:MAG: CBS domain-containing protein [Lachnospiraceae bacterium]
MNILFFLTPKSELAYLYPDYSVKKTLDIMEQYRHAVIPLIDHDGKYCGIITEGDLLYNLKNEFHFNLANADNIPISCLDTRRTYEPVSISATVEEVFKKSMVQKFVPVVDDDGIFIGIVKRRDIIHYFYDKYIHEQVN